MVQGSPSPPTFTGVVLPPARIRQFTERDGRLSPSALQFLQQVFVAITGGDGILPNIATIQADIDQLETDVTSLQTALDTLQDDVDALEADLQAQIDDLVAEDASLQSQITALVATDVSLQSQINTLTTTTASLQSQIDALRRGGPYVYSVPASGDTITTALAERRRVIDPGGTLAALTLVMPPTPLDQDFFDLSTSQTITTMTITPPGAQIVNGSTFNFPANTGVGWLFRAANSTWYRRV